MAHAYSFDLRIRVLRAIDNGLSARAAADRFDISRATAIRWADQWRRTGQQAPCRPGKKPNHGTKLDPHRDFILNLISNQPDLTLKEIAQRLQLERDVSTSLSALCRFLKRQNLTFKKKDSSCNGTAAVRRKT